MKRLTLLLAQLLFFCSFVSSQDTSHIGVTYMPEYKGDRVFISYDLYNPEAEQLLKVLLDSNNKRKGKNFVHRFRNQRIDGLSEPVTIRIHEGIEKKLNEKEGGFNTFLNQKYKENRIKNMKENERLGILIYLINNSRLRGNDVIDNELKSEIVIKYLSELIK